MNWRHGEVRVGGVAGDEGEVVVKSGGGEED
jgi:hypothetical protein